MRAESGPGRSIAIAMGLIAVTGVAAAMRSSDAAARAASCQRGGATLIAASRSVRVVALRTRPVAGETLRERLLGCRPKNGRRFLLAILSQSPEGGRDAEVEIHEDRYIGLRVTSSGGASEHRSAVVWDAVRQRKLHDSRACDFDRGVLSGINEVVFLPRGGMAYACQELRIASSAGDRQLEPRSADAHELAITPRTGPATLYWAVTAPSGEERKSLRLP